MTWRDTQRISEGLDEKKMLHRVNYVAHGWSKRLRHDASHDVGDLAQELFIRYLEHFKEHDAAPGELTVRRWAWDVMRSWGYRGRNGGELRSTNPEISYSHHKLLREGDYTDEELIENENFRRETGMRGSLDDES